MSKSVAKRYYGLDILKCICALLVICIHEPFAGIVGKNIVHLARVAVPIFFMITGFFYQPIIDRKREAAQIKKTFKFFLWANLFFMGLQFVFSLAKFILTSAGASAFDEFISYFSLESIFNFIILNESPFSSHLWYLGAILYVLLIAYALRKIGWFKILYWATPVLLLADLVFGKYAKVFWGHSFDYIYVRNFLCVGIPYFTIGVLIYKNKDKISSFLKNKKLLCIGGIILFAVTTILEYYLLVSVDLNAARDHYISTTFLSVLIFIFFMLYFNNQPERKSFMSVIGQKYSTMIYIMHIPVITVTSKIAGTLHITGIYNLVAPIVVFVATLLFCIVYYWLLDKVKLRFSKTTVKT